MDDKPCYKINSLQDFAAWASDCGHYCVAPLIQNYQEYLRYVERHRPLDGGDPPDD